MIPTDLEWLICRDCGQGPHVLRWPNGRIDHLYGAHADDCPRRGEALPTETTEGTP